METRTGQWTPGPWKVAGHGDGNKQLPITAWDGKIIAAIRDNGNLADARLIAAAPDLVAALRDILAFSTGRTNKVGLLQDKLGDCETTARAALAKAGA